MRLISLIITIIILSLSLQVNADTLSDDDFIQNDSNVMPECEFSASSTPEVVPIKDKDGLWNLALLKNAIPNASSIIVGYPLRHSIDRLTDGWYNNCRSWVAANELPSWVEADLGDEYIIYKVVFGSEHTLMFNDRAATKFTILIATEYNVSSNSTTWKEVFNYNGKEIHKTTSFNIQPVQARYVRVKISSPSGVRIDELEIYGKEISSCQISDLDQDGVIDIWDKCPNTAINNFTDKHGCSIESNSAVSGFISMEGSPIAKGKAMLIQSGELHQEAILNSAGQYKFDRVNKDKPFSVILRKTVDN